MKVDGIMFSMTVPAVRQILTGKIQFCTDVLILSLTFV